MKKHPYSVRIVHRAKKGPFPSFRAELLEHDVIVCRFKRESVKDGYVPPITFRFLSEMSQVRFLNFADSISIEESLEALAGV